ncbi:MAG: 7-carboxy-7-deazaguanine synthase QueE [Chloroflexota bacterium]|nr:7-carboxy-7-deazaguanine synthase QueE [Chloroflexota bacterium]
MSAPVKTPNSHPRIQTYPIVEIFGPVIQGEGAMIGRQTHFVRLGGCDYRCTWCDTLYAVLPDQVRANSARMSDEDVVERLRSLGTVTPWVTLSGGNPALHVLDSLVAALHAAGYRVAVETQGSIYRSWLETCDLVTVSPKPPSSGMETDLRALDRFVGLPGAKLKVVVFDDADFAFGRSIHRRYPDVPFYLQVGNEVGADATDALLQKLDWLSRRTLADPELGEAVVLPQLHVLLYGNRRGV